MGTLRKKPHNENMEERRLPTLWSQRAAVGLIAILATNISGKKNFGSFSRSEIKETKILVEPKGRTTY